VLHKPRKHKGPPNSPFPPPAAPHRRLPRTRDGLGEPAHAATECRNVEQHAEDRHRGKTDADRSGKKREDAAVGKHQSAPQALVKEGTEDQSRNERRPWIAL